MSNIPRFSGMPIEYCAWLNTGGWSLTSIIITVTFSTVKSPIGLLSINSIAYNKAKTDLKIEQITGLNHLFYLKPK